MNYARIAIAALLAGWSSLVTFADYTRPSWVKDFVPYFNNEDPRTKASPSNPPEWPSAQATGYYYVWPQGPGATNTANTYGYPDKPRTSVPTTIGEGEVVVMRGTFTATTTTWYLTFNGTAANPCWFRGDGTNNPNLEIASIVVKGQWAYLENLIIGNGNANTSIAVRPHNNSTANHIIHRNITARGTATDGTGSAFSVYGLVASGTRNSEIFYYRCFVDDYGDKASTAESDYHAFHPSGSSGYVNNVWILDCGVGPNGVGGDGVQIGNATATAPNWGTNIFVDQFSTVSNGENAIDIKGCANVVVSRVTGSGYDGHKDTSPGEGIVVHNGPDNVWLINNRITDSIMGLVSTGAVKQYWIGNRIEDCDEGLVPDRGGGTIYAYQNLMARCGIGLTGTGTIGALHNANNIIWDHDTRSLELTMSGVRAASTIDNDLIYKPGGSVSIDWSQIYTTVESWDTAQAAVNNALEADPLFVNAAADNFALQAGSPARGAGYNWTTAAESDFYAAFGWTAEFADINGVAFDSTLDLGPIMYAAGVPTAPTGLAVGTPTSSSLTVTWTDASSDETGFSLEISTVGSGSGFTEVATPAANATSQLVSSLNSSTTYFFRIRAENASGYSTYSAEASGTTSAATTTINAGTASAGTIVITSP